MLKYVFDHMSQGKMKQEREQIGAALDVAVKRCHPSAEVFVRMTNKWVTFDEGLVHDAAELSLLHLAVVKRSCTAAGEARIKQAGWISLGKVADPASAIIKRLGVHLNEPWSPSIHAFFHDEWAGLAPSRRRILLFGVSAPVQFWSLVDYFKWNITQQMEEDWAMLTSKNDRLVLAYLQVLTDHRMA